MKPIRSDLTTMPSVPDILKRVDKASLEQDALFRTHDGRLVAADTTTRKAYFISMLEPNEDYPELPSGIEIQPDINSAPGTSGQESFGASDASVRDDHYDMGMITTDILTSIAGRGRGRGRGTGHIFQAEQRSSNRKVGHCIFKIF